MDTLYIVIPAYNEQMNIKTVLEEWYPVVEKHHGNGNSRLLVIDDGSKDATYQIIKEWAKDKPLCQAITKKNAGHGATVLYGYHYALKEGAQYIFQTDSDGQTRPSEFEAFWKRRERYDLVIGWRKQRQDGAARIMVTKVLKLVVRLCFGVDQKDVNTPYRLMKAESLKMLITYVPKDYFLSNALLVILFDKMGYQIKYLPITFRQRQGGKNSIKIRNMFRIGLQAVKDFRRINRRIGKIR